MDVWGGWGEDIPALVTQNNASPYSININKQNLFNQLSKVGYINNNMDFPDS